MYSKTLNLCTEIMSDRDSSGLYRYRIRQVPLYYGSPYFHSIYLGVFPAFIRNKLFDFPFRFTRVLFIYILYNCVRSL